MKISKNLIVILFIGLTIIGAGFLYMMWQEELDRGDELNTNLDTAQSLLPVVTNGITAAQADLNTAQARLAAAQAALAEYIARFPSPPPQAAIQSIDYGTKLFILAANNSLNLWEFHADNVSSITVGSIRYQSTAMDILVTGDIVNINDFIGNLETSDPYLTATIDSVSIHFEHDFDSDLGAVPPPQARIIINILALED